MVKAAMTFSVPEKPTLDGIEEKWSKNWEKSGVFTFREDDTTSPIFSIDTPPPTVSGSLHAGHVLSYTHTDIMARFKRMTGHNVFYPMGWDDNGLPTERRVQNYYGIACDPSISYVPTFVPTPPTDANAKPLPISRTNFVNACQKLTQEDEQAFEKLWRTLGLSVDWSKTYTTIGQRAQRVSQLSFIRLFKEGALYHGESPTLWDVDFQSAVSQAELEDKEEDGLFYSINFSLAGTSDQVEIQTTRPELLASCVALVANPKDPRYQSLFGKFAITPLFEVEVPILAHPLAEIDKGSGIAMICTFGDLTDVLWWKELNLALRPTIDRRGRLASIDFSDERFPSKNPNSANAFYSEIEGKTTKTARTTIAKTLEVHGFFHDQPKKVRHSVKYFEKGDKPLEVVTSWQWYIRTLAHKERLLELGKELHWNPPYMKVRYDNWVNGLASDWNISRQRYFGIPIPVWYPIDDEGQIDRLSPILPEEDELPIDPFQDTPSGYDPGQRGEKGGFIGDYDVMDTWATSSLTPQIASGWEENSDLFKRLFPMDLRPQGQDIIRTWLFYTILRSYLSEDRLPWKNTVISGFVLDPDRKKMSKSKGNVVTPMPLIEKHGADALRYWAANGRPGVDTAADENSMKIGRRLAIKVLNASKFALAIAASELDVQGVSEVELSPIDEAVIRDLEGVVANATKSLDSLDHTRGLEATETFFWSFCDNYLELIKIRAYGTSEQGVTFTTSQTLSARITALAVINTSLRLLAPYLPFATEEVWSWFESGSVHSQDWPNDLTIMDTAKAYLGKLTSPEATLKTGEANQIETSAIYQVLSKVRRAKSEAKTSMKSPVSKLKIVGSSSIIRNFELAKNDLMVALVTNQINLVNNEDQADLEVEIELAPR
ncbi:valine--tRNA ligase [Acidithrix ferrooxidans]